MVKTLRITTVVAALLAIAVFALPVFYGIRTDENIDKFLNSPGIVAAFKATSGSRTHTTTNQVHPLVQQAQDFALILNPPKPVIPENEAIKPAFGRNIADFQPKNTPKFTVKCTSYYELNPEMSLALIDEPGKGTYWVRQSGTVNHLLIEQVKDGVIIVRNGDETFEIKTEEKKILPPPQKGMIPPITKSGNPVSRPDRPPVTTKPNTSKTTKPETDAQRSLRVTELVDNIKQVGATTDDPNINQLSTEERAARMQKLITDFKNSNMNISDEESKRLSDLGVMLGNVTDTNSGN